MKFVDKLDKVCPKCSENSKKVYLQNIRRLYRFKDKDATEVPSTSKWLESDAAVNKYKALPYNVRRALSLAGVKAARAYGVNSDKWYKRLVDDQDEYNTNRKKNKRTDAEDAKMLKGGLKELKKISSEYKRQINRELKEKPNLKTLSKYQLYLSLRLFVDLPFRNDFPTFELTENQKGNYIVYKKKKKAIFVLNKFKLSDKLGPRKVEISPALTKTLKLFLKYRDGLVKHDFLLSNTSGEPMSKQAFSKAIHKVTKDLSGKSFGSRILRILHATESADIIEQSAELTNKLLHTASQTKLYIKK